MGDAPTSDPRVRTRAQIALAEYARAELVKMNRQQRIDNLNILIRQSRQRLERLQAELAEEPRIMASLERCLAEELRAKQGEGR